MRWKYALSLPHLGHVTDCWGRISCSSSRITRKTPSASLRTTREDAAVSDTKPQDGFRQTSFPSLGSASFLHFGQKATRRSTPGGDFSLCEGGLPCSGQGSGHTRTVP